VEIFATCESHLAKMLETIYIGDMVSIELAKLNKVDPTPVKVIENLKNKLGGK
jgi:glucose/mannose-6-phosphate isomerase